MVVSFEEMEPCTLETSKIQEITSNAVYILRTCFKSKIEIPHDLLFLKYLIIHFMTTVKHHLINAWKFHKLKAKTVIVKRAGLPKKNITHLIDMT